MQARTEAAINHVKEAAKSDKIAATSLRGGVVGPRDDFQIYWLHKLPLNLAHPSNRSQEDSPFTSCSVNIFLPHCT